jgi:hypothetical protein
MTDNPLGHLMVFDERDDPHPASTGRTEDGRPMSFLGSIMEKISWVKISWRASSWKRRTW